MEKQKNNIVTEVQSEIKLPFYITKATSEDRDLNEIGSKNYSSSTYQTNEVVLKGFYKTIYIP